MKKTNYFCDICEEELKQYHIVHDLANYTLCDICLKRLKTIQGNEAQLEQRFYKDIAFGYATILAFVFGAISLLLLVEEPTQDVKAVLIMIVGILLISLFWPIIRLTDKYSLYVKIIKKEQEEKGGSVNQRGLHA